MHKDEEAAKGAGRNLAHNAAPMCALSDFVHIYDRVHHSSAEKSGRVHSWQIVRGWMHESKRGVWYGEVCIEFLFCRAWVSLAYVCIRICWGVFR